MENSVGRQPSLVTPTGDTQMAIITALAIMAGRGKGVPRNNSLLGYREKVCRVGAGKCLFRGSEWKDIL